MTTTRHGGQAPVHGYRGEGGPAGARPRPAGLTVAISREAGARGGSIGRRVARRLGWQVVDGELLDYLVQEGVPLGELPESARQWAEERLDWLRRERELRPEPSTEQLARVLLTLGATGEVVIVGRGAGHLLPAETTLHVRIAAPLADRVAYMGQWLRLAEAEAAEQVRQRDRKRAEFIAGLFTAPPPDLTPFDLQLNSSLLGEELCAELIVQAARGKSFGLGAKGEPPPLPPGVVE
jgi:cytidylate kinase